MSVKQISVFLENKTGSLVHFTEVLQQNGIDLMAISLADTTDFGIIRAIVDKTELAHQKLKEGGFSVTLTEVLAIAVSDSPGGLAGALGTLADGGITIEYLYSLVRTVGGDAIILCRVDQPVKAAELLRQKDIRLLEQSELVAG